MSSRAGNVILYEDFRDQVLNTARAMLKDREIPEAQKEIIAQKIAFSAIKFSILLQDSEKGITFDDSQALSFEGETGPYLEYTYARICSVLKKGKEENSDFQNGDYTLLQDDLEKKLLLQIAQFSDIIQKASATYKPNYIARFALDLAQTFNTYYHSCKIHSDDVNLTNARLRLCQDIAQVFKNAFYLLGIEEVEVM